MIVRMYISLPPQPPISSKNPPAEGVATGSMIVRNVVVSKGFAKVCVVFSLFFPTVHKN